MTLKDRVVYDPITKRFIQKDHIVRGKKVLDYPIDICVNNTCRKEFPKKRVDQKFCSTPCRLEYHTRISRDGRELDLSPKICPIDGVEFTPTREWSKYCSPACQAEARRRTLAKWRQAKLSNV